MPHASLRALVTDTIVASTGEFRPHRDTVIAAHLLFANPRASRAFLLPPYSLTIHDRMQPQKHLPRC